MTMNRIFTITLGVFLLSTFTFTPDVQAQRFLKGLADKAKEKVKEKLDQKLDKKMDDAIDDAFDGKREEKTTERKSEKVSYTSEEDYTESPSVYVAYERTWRGGDYFSIDRANDTGESDDEGNAILRIKKSNLFFKTQKDVIAAIPAVPTTRQILSSDQAVIDKLINFDLAVNDLYARKEQAIIESSMKATQAAMMNRRGTLMNAPSAPSMPASNALSQKIIEALMSSGVDMESIDEEEAMKVAARVIGKEYGIPEAEMVKMIKMSQTNPDAATAYMKKNFPVAAEKLKVIEQENKQFQDKVESNSSAIELHEIFQELVEYRDSESYNEALGRMYKIQSELTDFANDLLRQWQNSPECAKVESMEKDLVKRVDEYFAANNKGYNDQLPEFWEKGRKEQNAIINAYNETLVEKWRSKLQGFIDYLLPFAQKDADFEARIEQAKSRVKSTDANTIQMQNVLTGLNGASFNYVFSLPAIGMDAPRVDNVTEDRYSQAM